MKVLLQGYFGWYGSMAEWVKESMIAIGWEVTTVERTQKADSTGYDLYLIVDCSEDYSANVSDKTSTPTVYWSMDAHMPGGIERTFNMVKTCDVVLSSNREYGVDLLQQHGIKATLLPITYVNSWVPRVKPLIERKYDVVMIGHPNSQDRLRLWDIVHKQTNSYVTGRIETKEGYIEAMSNAKVVINQPTEPWDTIVNNRCFEAMGFGSLLLQKKLQTQLLSEMGYIDGRDMLYWNTLDELQPKLDMILANVTTYQQIASSGHFKVQKHSLDLQILKLKSIL